MKLILPSKKVEVCDLCRRKTNVLTGCVVCGKEYCYMCHPCLPGCMIKPHVCKNCDDREDVQKVVDWYSHNFVEIVKLREKALARLPKANKK